MKNFYCSNQHICVKYIYLFTLVLSSLFLGSWWKNMCALVTYKILKTHVYIYKTPNKTWCKIHSSLPLKSTAFYEIANCRKISFLYLSLFLFYLHTLFYYLASAQVLRRLYKLHIYHERETSLPLLYDSILSLLHWTVCSHPDNWGLSILDCAKYKYIYTLDAHTYAHVGSCSSPFLLFSRLHRCGARSFPPFDHPN